MNWFKNLGTFAKLMTAFGLLGLIMAATVALAVGQLATLQANTAAVYNRQLLPLVALSDIQDDVQRIRQDSYKMFTTTDPEETRAVVEQARALDRDLAERIDRFVPLAASAEELASFNRFREAAQAYRQHREEHQYGALLAGRKEVAFEAAKAGAPKYEEAVKELKDTIAAKQEGARRQFEACESVHATSRLTLLALAAAGLLAGQVLGFAIARLVVRPLRQLTDAATRIAAGDTEVAIEHRSRDETGVLADAFRGMLAYVQG
ncbi:MAG TPA: MCP four helix bundle domain-containing protein, partial [Gemmataceae bacterium]|nr:MCP four helix bundle domain-containing protein [Gemmataceae bacterium]